MFKKILLLALVVSVAVANAVKKSDAAAQIEWLRSKGGFFSTKIEFQPLDKTNPSSPNGMFATEFIKSNEKLIVVPQKCLITSKGTGSFCDTARYLVEEYKLGEDSEFSPYVNYLFDEKQFGKLPSAWSDAGVDLLETIIGRELEPQGVADISFDEDCEGDSADDDDDDDDYDDNTSDLLEHAYQTVIARGWQDKLLPVYDMVNHRNGKYHNIDQATSAHTGGDIKVIALRDIQPGEQLYISYNECHDIDCEGTAHTYTLPNILRDYGFVEQYPRRWNIDTKPGQLLFELDELEESGQLQLRWLDDHRPDTYQINWLKSHITRLRHLSDFVSQGIEALDQTHEKEITTEFYQALMTALEYAIDWADDEDTEECEIAPNGYSGESAMGFSREYDNLEEVPDPLDYNLMVCNSQGDWYDEDYSKIDHVVSQYQDIEFKHSSENQDTCLYLVGWVQACTSFRPHYHEAFVHYPARFVDEVKRVIFLGGGDNMILHEILKYESLELVVGMELDQQVVRGSFKNLGTQPHFDNDKLQWWFGDACKSLLMLPSEYYGSFDLVLVDLMTFVADTLMVTKELSIMDVAELLVKPDGVIARNEDFIARRNVKFAEYTVDLEYHDVPLICQQSITIGSNTVDFLSTTPKDHGIETVYFETDGGHFDGWVNYRRNVDHIKICKGSTSTKDANSLGVLMILEAEDAVAPLDSSARASISKALEKAGLTEISGVYSQKNKGGNENITMVFVFQEGYVVARAWPEHKYCGFDILLWSRLDKLDTTKAELLVAVGSNNTGRSSSSYRIVTGGMHGVVIEETFQVGPNAATGECDKSADVPARSDTFEEGVVDTILGEMISLIHVADPVVVVLCGDQKSPCRSLEVLKQEHATVKAIPVWACPGVTGGSSELGQDASQRMVACEGEARGILMAAGKISGFVIDGEAPRSMGQILLKILDNSRVRAELLAKEYVVLTPIFKPTEESWRTALLERFRTDLVRLSPAFHADVFFNSTTSSLQLGVFSSGDTSFYSHLVDVTAGVEKKAGLVTEVRNVKDGVVNFVADFEPSKIVTDADYDHGASHEQWLSQRPMGQQTIFQFEIQAPKPKIEAGESVLVNYRPHVWKGRWLVGEIKDKKDDGSYFVTLDGSEVRENIGRDLIRKLETAAEASTPIDYGERILIRDGPRHWYQGSVLERRANGTYKIQGYDDAGTVEVVQRSYIIRQLETTDTKDLPAFSTDKLKDVFTLVSSTEPHEMKLHHIGDGCVIVAFWSEGSAIASWDGRIHIDVNLFTNSENTKLRDNFETVFLEEIPFLVMTSHDEQPRGFGRVVNFQQDLESFDDAPHWTEFA